MFKQHQPIKYLSIEKIFLLICLLFVQTAFSGNSVESTFDNDGATSWKFIEKLSPAEKQTFDAIIANTNLTKAQTESALQAWALTQNATVQADLQNVIAIFRQKLSDYISKVTQKLENDTEALNGLQSIKSILNNTQITRLQECEQIVEVLACLPEKIRQKYHFPSNSTLTNGTTPSEICTVKIGEYLKTLHKEPHSLHKFKRYAFDYEKEHTASTVTLTALNGISNQPAKRSVEVTTGSTGGSIRAQPEERKLSIKRLLRAYSIAKREMPVNSIEKAMNASGESGVLGDVVLTSQENSELMSGPHR